MQHHPLDAQQPQRPDRRRVRESGQHLAQLQDGVGIEAQQAVDDLREPVDRPEHVAVDRRELGRQVDARARHLVEPGRRPRHDRVRWPGEAAARVAGTREGGALGGNHERQQHGGGGDAASADPANGAERCQQPFSAHPGEQRHRQRRQRVPASGRTRCLEAGHVSAQRLPRQVAVEQAEAERDDRAGQPAGEDRQPPPPRQCSREHAHRGQHHRRQPEEERRLVGSREALAPARGGRTPDRVVRRCGEKRFELRRVDRHLVLGADDRRMLALDIAIGARHPGRDAHEQRPTQDRSEHQGPRVARTLAREPPHRHHHRDAEQQVGEHHAQRRRDQHHPRGHGEAADDRARSPAEVAAQQQRQRECDHAGREDVEVVGLVPSPWRPRVHGAGDDRRGPLQAEFAGQHVRTCERHRGGDQPDDVVPDDRRADSLTDHPDRRVAEQRIGEGERVRVGKQQVGVPRVQRLMQQRMARPGELPHLQQRVLRPSQHVALEVEDERPGEQDRERQPAQQRQCELTPRGRARAG